MKSITCKNFVAIMVLGALAAPLSSHAAATATVNITATVTEKFSIAVDKSDVSFSDGGNSDVKITTISNAAQHGSGASITIQSNVAASGKTIQLKHITEAVSETYPVDIKIGNTDANFDTNKKTSHIVARNNSTSTQETMMKLTSARALQSVPAGEYKGILTITVSPA